MSALKRKLENSDEANPIKIAKKVAPSNDSSDLKLSEHALTDDEVKDNNLQNEANEDEEEDGEDDDEIEDDEEEDEDHYLADDFLVDEQGDEDDGSVSDTQVKKSKSHQKLKKNKRKFLLDEDDQLLIQETIPEKKEPEKIEHSEGAEIEPDVSEDESDVNDFIEDDGFNQSKPVAKRNMSRKSLFSHDGPTYDQVQEARDIFGDGYDEIGEDESFYDENDEEGLKASTLSKAKGDKRSSGFEYIQLVQNFCLDDDEIIRETDVPERLQVYHASRDITEKVCDEEAVWIVHQLKSLKLLDFSPRNSDILIESVKTVLNFLLIDRLEIPFIWLYRRDYIDASLNRSHLWNIFWLDLRWTNLKRLQNKLQATAAKLVEVSDGTVSESMDDRNGLDASFKYLTQESAILMLQKLPINQYVEFVNRNMEEHAIHDTLSFIKLVTDQIMYEFRSQGLAKDRKSSKYLKYKALPAVQNLAEMICSPAVSVGAALLFDGTVQIPRIEETFEDVATRLLPESEFSSIEQLLSAATILIGTEFSFEPIVRKFARLVFKNRGTISTRPTTKGETAITPFSQFFGIHYIDQKPVSQFFSEEGLLQFMNMIEAESLGLIQILINAPQKSIDGKLIIDLEPFFGEGLRLFEFFMPREHASLDPNPKARMSWDFIRLNVLQVTIEKYLIPFLRSDLKSELLRLGKEVIADKVALSFEKRLSYGPCEPYFEDNREFLTRTLLNCPGRFCYSKVASLFVTQDRTPGLHMACVDSNGVLVAHQVIAPQSMGQKKDKIKAFLYDNRPELVVINSSAASLGREISGLVGKQILEEITETIELDRQLRRSQSNRDGFDDNNEEEDEEDDERNRKYSPNVVILNDAVANIMKNSGRRVSLLPDLPPDTAAAVSLARFAQEPLSEYANLWRSVDSTYSFGFELLYINHHPLQKFVLKEKLLEKLEVCLVNAISDIGVDLNKAIKYEHHSQLLAFLPGFGLRKAEAFRQRVQRMSTAIESREALLIQKLTGRVVWNNICGFLKITGKNKGFVENPLENTRIHPECYLMYDFAPKICADALGLESNPAKYSEIVLKLMKSVRGDLEKRVKKFPEWLDKWANGKPEYFLDGSDQHMYINSSKISIELFDCLQNLLLDEYVHELEVRGKGKRRIQFEHIKEELRYPWLDLRKPLEVVSQPELFDLIYGESQHSLYVGLKVGCVVQDVSDQTFEGRDELLKRRQRAIVKTDNGIKGFISLYEVSDESVHSDSNLSDKLSPGQHLTATVIGIARDKFFLDLSLKPSVMEHSESWWLENRALDHRAKKYWEQLGRDPERLFDRYFKESAALDIVKKNEVSSRMPTQTTTSYSGAPVAHRISGANSGASSFSRVIYHPLFANLDFKGAEEKLKREGKGAGAVVIRPSSKGVNFLALTWAFQENWFKHINIQEEDKRPGDLGLGARLIIQEDNLTYEFSDLDELYKFYIEPLNEFVSAMTKHKNFRPGTPDSVEREMRELLKSQPNRIPYMIRFEPGKPGVFMLTWLFVNQSRSTQIKTLKIGVSPSGYRIGNQSFTRPSELIDWFKKSNSSRA